MDIAGPDRSLIFLPEYIYYPDGHRFAVLLWRWQFLWNDAQTALKDR